MRSILLCFCFVLIAGAASGQESTPSPEQIREEVVVTASRVTTRIADTPASMTVLSRTEIETAAAPVLDDVLRQSVGFSIFRRSSSRNANPTTQGVSLRGVGSSGASRTVVMFDGVPINDPFGGWVQWNRVAPVEVERVEVLRGGVSSLYGDTSLSGAVEVIPRSVDDKWTVSGDLFGGTQKTFSGSGFAGFKADRWIGSLTASSFQTRGYIPVEEAARGPVDSYAGVRSATYSARLARTFGRRASLFLRPSYFGEVRSNGTGLQSNRTHIRELTAGGDAAFEPRSIGVRWRVFGTDQVYDQTFSSINAARTIETLIRTQRVPARSYGGSGQISAVLGKHTFVAGVEARNVCGESDEIVIANNISTATADAGGRETSVGAFVHDVVQIGDRLNIAGGVRYDRWRNYGGFSVGHNLNSGQTTVTNFADRTEGAWSPQLAVLYHVTDRASLYINGSRNFRAPTLNELYRGFRVGNVLTLANANLAAERADNVEGGARYELKAITLKANAFWTRVGRPVSNVTLFSTPNLITRQRQNAGRTRTRGIEIEVEARLGNFILNGGYLFADARVTEFPANPQLVGLLIPQVPRHQFTAQANYSTGNWTFATQMRGSSEQFDDDLNQFRLEPYFQLDVLADRQISKRLRIYAAVENLLNSRYSVGKTPIRTVSIPITLRVGLRWN